MIAMAGFNVFQHSEIGNFIIKNIVHTMYVFREYFEKYNLYTNVIKYFERFIIVY